MFGLIVILDGAAAMRRKAAKRLHDAEQSTVGGLASTEQLRGAVHTAVYFDGARELPDR